MSVYSITLYSVCVHYTVQCLCTVLHCTVSVYSVCAQYYTVQCLCTVLHCTVSVYSITLYSVCVQYYTVQCLCAVLHCTFYSITVYNVCVLYYTVHIPLAECTTNLSQQDLKSSNYHKIDNNDHKKELRKTNFNKLEKM